MAGAFSFSGQAADLTIVALSATTQVVESAAEATISCCGIVTNIATVGETHSIRWADDALAGLDEGAIERVNLGKKLLRA